MRAAVAAVALALLAGCAGLRTGWRVQLDMLYETPPPAVKAGA